MNPKIKRLFRVLFYKKIDTQKGHSITSSENHDVVGMEMHSLFEIWNEIGYPKADYQTQKSFQKVASQIGLDYRRSWLSHQTKRLMRIAALFVLPILSVLTSFYFYDALRQERMIATIQYFVPDGKREKLILPDQSEVWVNGGSLVIYPEKFTNENREVYLSGEANFKVTHDKKHPFIVKTKSYEIEVLGTQFNVSAYPSDRKVVTALEEGSVKIKLPNNKNEIQLSPNQQFTYDIETNGHSCEYVNAHLSGNWKEGYLSFQQVPLEVVIRKIEHTYGVFFHFQKQKYRNDLLTVNFNKDESLSTIMAVIQEIVPRLKYSIDGNEIYIW